MIKSLKVLFFLCGCTIAHSQSLYFKTGKNFANYNFEFQNGESSQSISKLKSDSGSSFELGVSFPFTTSRFSYEVGVSLNELNSFVEKPLNAVKYKTEFIGIDNAITFSALRNKRMSLDAKFGLGFQSIVFGKQETEGKLYDLLGYKEFNGLFIKQSLGAQLKVIASNQFNFSMGYEYHHNLFNTNNNSSQSLYINNNQIKFGVYYLLEKKNKQKSSPVRNTRTTTKPNTASSSILNQPKNNLSRINLSTVVPKPLSTYANSSTNGNSGSTNEKNQTAATMSSSEGVTINGVTPQLSTVANDDNPAKDKKKKLSTEKEAKSKNEPLQLMSDINEELVPMENISTLNFSKENDSIESKSKSLAIKKSSVNPKGTSTNQRIKNNKSSFKSRRNPKNTATLKDVDKKYNSIEFNKAKINTFLNPFEIEQNNRINTISKRLTKVENKIIKIEKKL